MPGTQAQSLAQEIRVGNRPKKSRLWLLLSCIGIVLLFVALRWNNWNAPLIRDEGEYFYSAALLKSGVAPYAHSYLQKPPMIIYTYALAMTLLPDSHWSARFLAYFCVAAATVLLGWIARKEFGPGIAFGAMWLFTPMVLLPQEQQFYANTEMFLICPLLALIGLFAWQRKSGGGAWAWIAAGFLALVCVMFKYTVAPLVVIILLYWSDCKRKADGNAGMLRGWAFAALGGLAGATAVLGFFAAHGALRNLWDCTVVFNRYYAGTGNFGFSSLLNWLKLFAKEWWVLFLPPIFLLVRIMAVERRIWLWLALFAMACLTTNFSVYGQYYILVMPFWALLCAVGVREFSSWVAAKRGWNATAISRGIIAVMVILIVIPELASIVMSPPDYVSKKALFHNNPFRESELVAEHVASLTAPGDFVYVAGSEPQVLFYAHRRSPTRFVIAYPFMIPTPLMSGYQHEAIADLEKNPPEVIVFAASILSWMPQKDSSDALIEYVRHQMQDHYDLVGGTVWNKELEWKEPLSNADHDRATLLVYRRKHGG